MSPGEHPPVPLPSPLSSSKQYREEYSRKVIFFPTPSLFYSFWIKQIKGMLSRSGSTIFKRYGSTASTVLVECIGSPQEERCDW